MEFELLRDALAKHVASGALPGLVAAVVDHDDERVTVQGRTCVNGPRMRRDTLFRISSMTKPMVDVAALPVDVLGVLVARAASSTLPEGFQERVLGPLGMVDTGFHAPSPARLAASFPTAPTAGPAARARSGAPVLRPAGSPCC